MNICSVFRRRQTLQNLGKLLLTSGSNFATSFSLPTQLRVCRAWKSLSLYYHGMLLYAKKTAFRHLGKEFRCSGVKNGFRLTNNMPPCCKLDHDSDSFEICKLRNLAAKLQEANRLHLASMTNSYENVNLMTKIRRSPLLRSFSLSISLSLSLPLSLSLNQHIGATLAQLEQARKTFKTYDINKWKARMQQSASQCYRWLKALTFTPFQGLVSSSLNKSLPTTCITESLELIRDHWRRVWRRPELNFDAEFNAVDAEIDALPNPRHVRAWKPFKAVKMNNRPAGSDGWLGSELATLPTEAFIPFADFCTFCENAHKLLKYWRCASQVHLPKGSNAWDVTGLRPITLFSVWYRLWAASRLQCSDCQTWLSSWWPPFATGGKKGHEIYHALIPLINAAAKNQYIISLDFSLALDNCHPQLAIHVLSRLASLHVQHADGTVDKSTTAHFFPKFCFTSIGEYQLATR